MARWMKNLKDRMMSWAEGEVGFGEWDKAVVF